MRNDVTNSSAASLHLSGCHLIYDLPWSSQPLCVAWPSENRPAADLSWCSSPARTQMSRRASAAVTMLVNGLTKLGTTNYGSGSTATFCRRVAVYSGPFRRHEMTVLEIIIATLHCRTDGILAWVCSCTILSDSWVPRHRKLDKSAINIAISRN